MMPETPLPFARFCKAFHDLIVNAIVPNRTAPIGKHYILPVMPQKTGKIFLHAAFAKIVFVAFSK